MPRLTNSPAAEDGQPLSSAVWQAFDRLLLTGDQPIGVAVSGGGDSMALLAILRLWCRSNNRPIFAATVDHGLRPESRFEAGMVADWCAGRCIPHSILTVTGLAEEPGNLQANARTARYDALRNWSAGVCRHMKVLTAHTMDDQAETVLMRLARGSGAEGLSGMAEEFWWQGVPWVRPLLGFRRADLRAWMEEEGVPWVDDPSNDDLSFDRIKARRALETLAPIGITVEGLAKTADRLRRQAEVLEQDAALLKNRALRTDPSQTVAEIDREALQTAHPDTAMRFLAETLRRVGGREYRPRFRALELLYNGLLGTDPFRSTLSLCIVEATENTVTIRPEHD